MHPLRLLLRDKTNADHNRIDAAYSKLDLKNRSDFSVFLLSHLIAMKTLRPVLKRLPVELQFLETESIIRSDLGILGTASAVTTPVPIPKIAEPLGTAYVIAGSHLGRKLLRNQWSKSSDVIVLSAASFMKENEQNRSWQFLLSSLKEFEFKKADVENLIQSSKTTFEVFEIALRAAQSEIDTCLRV